MKVAGTGTLSMGERKAWELPELRSGPPRFDVNLTLDAERAIRRELFLADRVETGGGLFVRPGNAGHLSAWISLANGAARNRDRYSMSLDTDELKRVESARAWLHRTNETLIGEWHLQPESSEPSDTDLRGWRGHLKRTMPYYIAMIVNERSVQNGGGLTFHAWVMRAPGDGRGVCEPARVRFA
jgi:hypothetical protein